jgi:hypothetical protein
LAAPVVQELLDSADVTLNPSPLITYYFFEHNSENGKAAFCDKAYRAILAKLFQQFRDDPAVLDTFSFAMDTKSGHGQLTAIKLELLDTMRTLVARVGNWSIVIDAVDECEDEEVLLSDLRETFGDLAVNVLLFSRPNVRPLRKKLEPQQVLTIDRSHNLEDLELYFDTHLRRLQDLDILPSSASIEQLAQHLLKGADGMFQWARLMISHLQSEGLSKWQRLSVITGLTTPEKLEDMYIRILELLSSKALSEQSMARSIFGWLTFAERPLMTHQLQDVLTPTREGISQASLRMCPRPEEEEFTDFESSAVILSGSLVEKRSFPNSAPIHAFIHGSVYEFFRSRCGALTATSNCQTGSIDYFVPAVLQVQAELALQCLSYIVQRIPGAPLSGNMFESAQIGALNRLRPFLSYAALHWPYHLFKMGPPGTPQNVNSITGYRDIIEKIMSVLGNILLNRLIPMLWVELKYTFEKQTEKHDALHTILIAWSQWIQTYELEWLPEDLPGVPPAIVAFAEDLITLHQFWGDTLIDGPHHIWQDVTAFTSSPFFVTTGAVTVKCLVSGRSDWSGRSTVPLSKISRDDPNTDFLATLTIWPSRYVLFSIYYSDVREP